MKRAGFVLMDAAALVAVSAAAAQSSTLFGGAEIVSPGNDSPHAVEVNGGSTTGSGIRFEIPAGTTFADLDELSTDYLFIEGTCGQGSPRFQVRVHDPVSNAPKNIFVYIGPPPNYTPCPTADYVNTGDLLEGTNPIDTSQLGGTFYDPYDSALAKYGGYEVLSVSLVKDPGLGQVVRFDNTVVDETLYTYDRPQNKADCKKGGWKDLTRDDGSEFKNQGDCIQYANTGK